MTYKGKVEGFDKKNIADIIALTPMQEVMLFHHFKASESDHYFEQLLQEV